jgi:hypothetical protein
MKYDSRLDSMQDNDMYGSAPLYRPDMYGENCLGSSTTSETARKN